MRAGAQRCVDPGPHRPPSWLVLGELCERGGSVAPGGAEVHGGVYLRLGTIGAEHHAKVPRVWAEREERWVAIAFGTVGGREPDESQEAI